MKIGWQAKWGSQSWPGSPLGRPFRRRLAYGTALAVLVLAGLLWSLPSATPTAPRIRLHPIELAADGHDVTTLTIEGPAGVQPRISAPNVTIEDVVRQDGHWQAQIRGGVLPGRIPIRVEFPGLPAATADLTTLLNANDTFEDGTPDFLRLDDERDRRAFRRWFTYLAEVQYFQAPANRPVEIADCAALIRYAYREALHAHAGGWAETARVPVVPAFDSIRKYRYPYTPLGASLFRITEGAFRASDIGSGAFAQFADAQIALGNAWREWAAGQADAFRREVYQPAVESFPNAMRRGMALAYGLNDKRLLAALRQHVVTDPKDGRNLADYSRWEEIQPDPDLEQLRLRVQAPEAAAVNSNS